MPIDDRRWAAHWLLRKAGGTFAYDAVVAVSEDAGATWSEPLLLHTDATPTEHGFVSLYSAGGGVGALWLDGRDLDPRTSASEPTHAPADETFYGTQLRTAVIEDGARQAEGAVDGVVCDCCATDVAMLSSGAVAVYRNRTREEIRDVYVARQLDGRWQAGAPVARDGWKIAGCPVNGPTIDARGDRLVVAWYTAVPSDRVQVAFSFDAGASFEPAIDMDAPNTIGRVDVALLRDGSAAVSWLERDPGRLSARTVGPDGRLGERWEILEVEATRKAGFPQMVARERDLVFAWTEWIDGQSRVRARTFGL